MSESLKPTSHLLTVPAGSAGARLDAFIAEALPELSRTRAKALILGGQVAVDGTPVGEARRPVKPGEAVRVTLPPPEPAAPAAEDIPLAVVYEDDDLIVIDKPAGLVVHPAAGNRTGTLVNALIAHCGAQPLRHRRRDAAGHRPPPRQGHVGPDGRRQDRPAPTAASATSSPSTAAPGSSAATRRSSGARRRAAKGTIDAPLGRSTAQPREDGGAARRRTRGGHPLSRARRYGSGAESPVAVTRRLPAGDRPHPPDPRAHGAYRPSADRRPRPMAPASRPRPARSPSRRRGRRQRHFPRQALHADLLGFAHPVTGEAMRFESPLPADFAALVAALGALLRPCPAKRHAVARG